MSCDFTPTALHGYLDGELDALRSAEFERHLEGCRDCAKALEVEESLRSLLQRSSLCESAPISLRKKIRADLDAATATHRHAGILCLGGEVVAASRPARTLLRSETGALSQRLLR